MPRLISAPFFSSHPVFRRAEYATAVGRESADRVVTAMLTQHLRAGNIKRVARGVFASVPSHGDARNWPVDHFLAASRLREGGTFAYHSALELHGYAYTVWQSWVQVVAEGQPCVYETNKFSCHFVSRRRSLARDQADAEGATTLPRMGLEIKVTTVERTIADLFDRPDLAGGAEELFNSLDLVVRLHAEALIRHVRARGNATAAGAMGFWLEREREWLAVPTQTLEELRALAPSSPRYALGARPRKGRAIRGWNVILPVEIVERRFEGR